jgi:Na+-translocating ferredoxin:NAD+ oxidoreductase RnfG subunit
LKKHLFNLLKILLITLLVISSGTALFYQLMGFFHDPVKTIQELKSQNKRDEALDLVQFYKENNTVDPQELEPIEKNLEYTSFEKAKSFADGAVTGRVYNTYSGIGAIGSDLCLYGDIRDLTIQAWKYLKNEETDKIVTVLSGLGIILSTKPFLDLVASFSKNSVKFIREASKVSMEGTILKRILDVTLSLKESELVYEVLKKTRFLFPRPQGFFPMSAV